MILTKNYQVDDFRHLQRSYVLMNNALDDLTSYHLDTPERLWEYGMALYAIDEMCAHFMSKQANVSVLDVGSGKSPFPYILFRAGYFPECADVIGRPWEIQRDWPWIPAWHDVRDGFMERSFDFTTSISVIEHINDDSSFLRKLWDIARVGMFLTYDSTEDGHTIDPRVHERTYTVNKMVDMVYNLPGAVIFGEIDFAYHGDNITVGKNSGSFGCVCARRK